MNWKNTIAAAVIMLSAFFLLGYINRPELIIPNKPLSTFPKTIGQWEGVEKRFEAIIYEVLGVDDSFYADYTNANGKWINLYIGYYQSQREGETIHSPKNCMPGGGWNIIESTTVPLNIGGNPESRIKIIKLVLQKGRQKQISYYWYHSRGRIISSEYLQKIYLVWDAVTRNRTDGSFVRLITPVDANESDTIAALEDFVRELFPILNQYIPS